MHGLHPTIDRLADMPVRSLRRAAGRPASLAMIGRDARCAEPEDADRPALHRA
jgi:hypothetical protein